MDRSSTDNLPGSPPGSPPGIHAAISSPSSYLEPYGISNSSDSQPLSDTAMNHPCRHNHPPTDIDRTSGEAEQPSGGNHSSTAAAHGFKWFFYNQRCLSPMYLQTTVLPPLVWAMGPPETTPILLMYSGSLWCLWTNSVDKKLWLTRAVQGLSRFSGGVCLDPIPAHD